MPKEESTIEFVSDRQKVSVPVSDILFVESRDREVFVHLSDGKACRNKTPITHWESILGQGFIRVHRAFLVNASHIGQSTQDTVVIDGNHIPVSRKYRDNLTERKP
jgi:DNA-binding LytR/AlgR family response regulator